MRLVLFERIHVTVPLVDKKTLPEAATKRLGKVCINCRDISLGLRQSSLTCARDLMGEQYVQCSICAVGLSGASSIPPIEDRPLPEMTAPEDRSICCVEMDRMI